MQSNPITLPGNPNVRVTKVYAANYTGSALVKGGVYASDIAKTNAATVTLADQCNNVVAVDATNIQGSLSVAENAIASLDNGECVSSGPVDALVSGTCAVGDPLKPVAGQNYLVQASRGTSTDIIVGKALATHAGAATTIPVLFDGLNGFR